MTARGPVLHPRLEGLGKSIFSAINELAARHEAVNLGQGAPDSDGPDFIKEAAYRAIRDGLNQYSRSAGAVELVESVSAHQERFYGLRYDPLDEITVCAGATEGIFATLQALVGPGDEVILFEPFYDSYLGSLAMVGATPKVVTLEAPSFDWDPQRLAEAVTPRTKAILFNSPHNPSGKVFGRGHLEALAELCQRHDLLAITDEVYEHLVFGPPHVPLASLPGMWERTILISSTAKTFSFTGWKVGYCCAPQEISNAIRTAHQYITFCQATPLQHAMAEALRAPDSYFEELRRDYGERRDLLCAGLERAGFDLRPPDGTYFAMADIRPLGYDDDMEFCQRLPAEVGVAAIPPSAFYVHPEFGRHLARFSFCKTRPVLEEAVRRLEEGFAS